MYVYVCVCVCMYVCMYAFRLRVRVKAMQQVIENQANRLADKEATAFSHQDESTGQGL